MSEWDELRDKYKTKNILPSLANLERIFAIGDKQQKQIESINNWYQEINYRLWNNDETLVITMDDMANLSMLLCVVEPPICECKMVMTRTGFCRERGTSYVCSRCRTQIYRKEKDEDVD